MRGGSLVAALLVALLTVAVLAVPAAPAAAQDDGSAPATRTVVTIQLLGNGDARWNVTTYVEINSSGDREAFDRMADRFKAGEASVAYDLETFRRAVKTVDAEKTRSMELVNPVRTTAVQNRTGRLTLTFRWTNFAVVDGDLLRVGDAFNTTEPWMPGLADRQRLVVRPPSNYRPYDAPKPIQQGGIVYHGPTTFDDDDLDIVFERTGPQTSPGNGTTSPGPGDGIDLSRLLIFGLLAVGIGAVALGAYLREADGDERSEPGEGAPDDVPAGAGAAGGVADDDVDTDLLSDEERVEYLLEENGGRMKQANIVKETGWSNAKVSQLLSAMADDDRVDKLRIGRENLISLPGEDVASLSDEPDE